MTARAERLRLDSVADRGLKNSDSGHEGAIQWIDRNIFQKASGLEKKMSR